MSVCVDKNLTREQVEEEANKTSPSGTERGWKISEDTHFAKKTDKDPLTNPCPCEQFPESRMHYLLDC